MAIYSVPSRRFEDHIRALCAKVINAKDKDIGPVISELQAALRENAGRLRKLVAQELTRTVPRNRRAG